MIHQFVRIFTSILLTKYISNIENYLEMRNKILLIDMNKLFQRLNCLYLVMYADNSLNALIAVVYQ